MAATWPTYASSVQGQSGVCSTENVDLHYVISKDKPTSGAGGGHARSVANERPPYPKSRLWQQASEGSQPALDKYWPPERAR